MSELTSFGGDDDGGFDLNLDKGPHASLPETSKEEVKLRADTDAASKDDAKPSSKETPATASDDATSTSLVGDKVGGFNFDTDHAAPDSSQETYVSEAGPLAGSDLVMNLSDHSSSNKRKADKIRRVLLHPAKYTENSYRYLWNQSNGKKGLQAICEYALGNHPDKETRGGRRSRCPVVDFHHMMSLEEAHFHAHVAVTHRLGPKK